MTTADILVGVGVLFVLFIFLMAWLDPNEYDPTDHKARMTRNAHRNYDNHRD